MVGQLPNFLKKNLKTITIHKGNYLWSGGNNDILIHTGGYSPDWIECEEEVIIHEGGHVSLDWAGEDQLNHLNGKKQPKQTINLFQYMQKKFLKEKMLLKQLIGGLL